MFGWKVEAASEAAEVISGEIGAEEQPQESYLKEHVVGILFSRSKLTHLQKQVRFRGCSRPFENHSPKKSSFLTTFLKLHTKMY
mgnify:FL=1